MEIAKLLVSGGAKKQARPRGCAGTCVGAVNPGDLDPAAGIYYGFTLMSIVTLHLSKDAARCEAMSVLIIAKDAHQLGNSPRS
jgi:hypothetical protein